eukprot:429075-Pelagomonas_calceolata.AAC.1
MHTARKHAHTQRSDQKTAATRRQAGLLTVSTQSHTHAGSDLCTPWGAGLVNMDIGSGDKLAQHNLQIP